MKPNAEYRDRCSGILNSQIFNNGFFQSVQHRILECTRSNAKAQRPRSSLGSEKIDNFEI